MQLSICFFGSSRGGQRVAPKRHRKLDILKIMVLYCQGILFDLDGVLVDSIQAVERVWLAWARENDLDPALVIEHAHGRRTIETVRLVAPHLDAEREDAKVEAMEIVDGEGVKAIAGAALLLASLPPDRYLIVTSASEALARARMGFAALAMPSKFVTADQVSHGKPHPEPYLKGAKRLGFSAQDCIVFEDTAAGIQSAKAAGTKVVGLTTTYPASALDGANVILKDLSGIKVQLENGSLKLTLPE